jgi:selenocysteine-specific elongation factor
VHLGTAECGARVVAVPGGLAAGMRAEVRVVLETPLVARGGDRFVLRGGSPLTTLGGGVVLDPSPGARRPRPWPPGARTIGDRLGCMLAESGVAGVDVPGLPVRLGLSRSALERLLSARGDLLRIGARLVATSTASALRTRVLARLDDHHREAPLEPGMSIQAVRAALGAPLDVCDAVLAELTRDGAVVQDGALVCRTGWHPTPTPAQQIVAERLAARLDAAGLEAPTVGELSAEFGPDAPGLLALAERRGRLVSLGGERYCSAAAWQGALERLDATLEAGQVYQPGVLRETLGISRKYLMSLLEQLDRQGVTERASDGRRWRGGAGTSRAT